MTGLPPQTMEWSVDYIRWGLTLVSKEANKLSA